MNIKKLECDVIVVGSGGVEVQLFKQQEQGLEL